jgi:hypothetical protein
VTPLSIPDGKIYQVTTSGDYSGILLQLTPEGFLAGVGAATTTVAAAAKDHYTWENAPKPEASIDYYRFGIQSTLKEELDSNFTALEVDGTLRQVWDPIVRNVLKAPEDYVQEITAEIFAIREKRLNLLSGAPGAPGAPVTKEALEALQELEDQYISLFMGKKIPHKVVRRFTFVPEKGKETATIFRFSEREGITTKNNVSAQPYILELKNSVAPEENAAVSRAASGVAYCVPAVADLCLSRGNEVLLEERCIVPQLGYTKLFPLEVIANEGYSLEFYPAYGSLKSVVKNR